MKEKDCPYGAEDCPKLKNLKSEMKSVNRKIDVAIALILILHGAELMTLII